jgi:hypothetical protein
MCKTILFYRQSMLIIISTQDKFSMDVSKKFYVLIDLNAICKRIQVSLPSSDRKLSMAKHSSGHVFSLTERSLKLTE